MQFLSFSGGGGGGGDFLESIINSSWPSDVIGSGNGLLPGVTNPLLDPILT